MGPSMHGQHFVARQKDIVLTLKHVTVPSQLRSLDQPAKYKQLARGKALFRKVRCQCTLGS